MSDTGNDPFAPELYEMSDQDALVQALHRLYAIYSDPSNPSGEDVDALWEEIVGRFPWLAPPEETP